MSFIPYRFLFRLSLPCRHVGNVPNVDGDDLVDLPAACRIDDLSAMDGRPQFAEVRLAWNEGGLAVWAEVRGKETMPIADASRPAASDGLTLWLDTRDARTSHRASRFCHQFHLLPTGGGPEKDEPIALQTKIHRAQQDAALAADGAIPFRGRLTRTGYRLEAFLPAAILTGFDPEQNRRLGLAYRLRDQELGEQTLGVGIDFPLGEDPSLWSVVELVADAE